MNTLNAVLTSCVDSLFAALATWPPILALVLVSSIAGILMAVMYRFSSNQRALRRAADQSRAQVLAIKLFKDDLGTMFRSLGQLMRHTGRRLWHSLPPMLVMIVPFFLLLAQLARWYEHRPLQPGETAIVELQISESDWPVYRTVSLEADTPLAVETPAVRDEASQKIFWRIRVIEAQGAQIRGSHGSESFEKTVSLASDVGQLSSVDPCRP